MKLVTFHFEVDNIVDSCAFNKTAKNCETSIRKLSTGGIISWYNVTL
jgi:hypothetical protein